MMPFLRRSTLFIVVAGTLSANDASAAIKMGPDGQPMVAADGNPIRQTPLESACESSLARFCPDLASLPGQSRSELICLRPFRASLPLGCRRLVGSAKR